MLKQANTGLSKADSMVSAGFPDFSGSTRSPWLGNESHSVSGGLIDVVPEWNRAIGHEADAVQLIEPLSPSVRHFFELRGDAIVNTPTIEPHPA